MDPWPDEREAVGAMLARHAAQGPARVLEVFGQIRVGKRTARTMPLAAYVPDPAITKAGDAGLRKALFNTATVMMHHARPCWLEAWGLQVARRRGQKRATMAVARRIGVVLHRMWLDGTEFRLQRESVTAAA